MKAQDPDLIALQEVDFSGTSDQIRAMNNFSSKLNEAMADLTSGPHYGDEYEAGFYDETSPEAQVPYPEGYLGHNLEHGYVIYWYNCDLVDSNACAELKDQIKASMADNGYTKLIAFPRASIDVPIAMSSWGQLLKMEEFDASQAKQFVSANRNRAPEPNAP